MTPRQNAGRPKRVLHVIHRMRLGGAQAMLFNIYEQIDRSQIQFDFAVRTQTPDYYDEKIAALGGRVFRLPWKPGNPLSMIRYTAVIERILREEGPFVALHSHTGLYSGHVLPVGTKVGVSLRLAHSHSSAPDKSSIVRDIWARVMRRRIRANVDYMLACSYAAAEWLYGCDSRYDPRCLIIPNAIALEPYAEIHDDRKVWRERIGLPLDGLLLGHIGRFDPVKNHAFLLDVFCAVLAVCPDAKLVLVGEGVLKSEMQRYAVERGIAESVHFLGTRSDIPQILGALDVFILPSLHEGLGIVLIEAQAAGVPCLVSSTVPEEVDLGLGLLEFKSLDSQPHEWAQSILKMTKRPAPSWNRRRTELQRTGYNIQTSATLLQELYLSAE